MEYYSVVKNNDMEWMEIENIILFEVTQTQNQENSIAYSNVDTTNKAKDNQSIVHNHREAW